MSQNSLKVDFYTRNGEKKGQTREVSFSIGGKSVVETETKRVVGSIKWGILKDRLFSAQGREIGFVKRAATKDLPLFLKPSQAYRVNRFDFFHELTQEFDYRLVYAWICREFAREHDSSGG